VEQPGARFLSDIMKIQGIAGRVVLAAAWGLMAMLAAILLYPARERLNPRGPQRHFPPDFWQFYFAGQLAADGRIAELYRQPAYEPLVRQTVTPPNRGGPLPMIRPAYVAYLCIPLSWLDHRTSLLLFTLGNLGLLVVLVWKVPAWFSVSPFLRPLLLGFFPFAWSIALSQDILLLTVLMSCAFYSASRGREARAGILLGLCSFKPHLIWLAPLAWLAGGKRRAARWFATTALTLAFVSFFSVGVTGFREWYGLLHQPYSDYRPETMGNLRALARHFGPGLAVLAGGLTVICLGLVLRRGSLNQKLSAAVLAAMILSPHTYAYDFSLGAVVALLSGHPAVRYAVLLPWPYFYPRTDLLPWVTGMVAYLVVLAARPAAPLDEQSKAALGPESVCPSV
jgi:hypothetical protein